jgi:hypothetical protein
MYQAQKVNIPPPQQPQQMRMNTIDGGLNVKYNELQISPNQSPYMLNLCADDRGALTKRPGQEVVHTFASGPIHALYNGLYKGVVVAAHGTSLSTWDPETDIETEIMSGLADQDGHFSTFSDKLLYQNGAQYIQFDGVTASHCKDSAYKPILLTGRAPSGGGTAYQEFNLLTGWFEVWFTSRSDSTAVEYVLPLDNLDPDTVMIEVVGAATPIEGTDFSVNRTTGKVTFNIAPVGTVDTNDVKISAKATQAGFVDKVLKHTMSELYGGATNDSRMFIAGGEGNLYRWSGLTGDPQKDFKYFPENSYNRIGSDYEPITGFKKQYGMLDIFKDSSIFNINYQYDAATGKSTFPVKSMNAQTGCNMPGSIQIVQDAPVFCHTRDGVNTIQSTVLENEKNVKPLSANVDGASFRPGLLDEPKENLAKASSVNFGGKYWLCVGSKVWVWDYKLQGYGPGMADDMLKWFYYENINAACFAIIDRELYYGDRETGNLVKFIPNYNDFGQPINGVWRSKVFNFDLAEWEKTVSKIWFETRAGTNTTFDIKFITDNDTQIDSELIKTKSYSYKGYSYADYTYAVYTFAVTIMKEPKLNKIIRFQIEFSNNELNNNLSLMSLVIKYSLDGETR